MSFRVAARTLLQLGAELISSDAVAFFELVKNAFDAGSPRADIDVVIRLDNDVYLAQRDIISSRKANPPEHEALEQAMADCKEAVIAGLDYSAPDAASLSIMVRAASSWDKLLELMDGANYILFEDTGSGMSIRDLEDVYLTVGTRYRLDERERQLRSRGDRLDDIRPILGEKGIGRLSAMRLGWGLQVETTNPGETRWNNLNVDWRWFHSPVVQFIEDIEVTPTTGTEKAKAEYSGTRIRINALTSAWSMDKLTSVANELSKFNNPFYPRSRFPISLRFNNDPVLIPRIEQILFEQAHARIQAEYILENGEPRLFGTVHYTLRNCQNAFSYGHHELFGFTDKAPVSVLQSLGPFSVEFYWYNRQALRAVDGIGTRLRVQQLVNKWSGGLMLFRDGFRVYPYGNPDDDWLDLDRQALASSGYKVNRKQIIGQVKIGAFTNTRLMDQTNREGLRECPEKAALVYMLKHLLEVDFRAFINQVDNEIRALEPISFDELEERASNEEQQMRHYIEALMNEYPQLKNDPNVVRPLEQSVTKIRVMLQEASALAESYEKGRTELLNLAGLGLMVEIAAHELNRATEHALRSLANPQQGEPTNAEGEGKFKVLEEQLKTLQKRLRILDPMSTAGRQVRERFDLIQWVDEILQSHQGQFDRHGVRYSLKVQPSGSTEGMNVRMVKGMVAQIIENLLSNSMYWLALQKLLDPTFKPTIEVVIDTEAKQILVTDNGPGVDPCRKEDIFQPFVTDKPPGQGKGLGLFVSREIASYHQAAIRMSVERTSHTDRLNTFLISLGSA